MRITLVTIGSRGDAEPYVALGRALARAGHAVRVATCEPFRGFVNSYGLEMVRLGGDIKAIVGDTGRAALEAAGSSPVRAFRALRRHVGPLVREAMEALPAALSGSDVVIGHLLVPGAAAYAERHGMLYIDASYVPVLPTRAFAHPGAPVSTPRGLPSLLSHFAAEQLFWQAFRPDVDEFRRRVLGMGPSPWLGSDTLRLARRPPKLFAFSPEIVPPPSDWPAHAFVTGHWFLDPPEGWAPPARLVEFFEAGEPPVYVGFGSMTAPRPEEVTRAVIEAVRKAGRRAVLSAGWGGLTASAEGDRAQSVRAHGVSAHGVSAHGVSAQGASAHGVSAQGASAHGVSAQGASEHGVRAEGVRANDILFVGDVPHGWLFPRVAGVVHHGGAGTTASAFRAGVPQMAIPFLADQPFWGHRIAQLGAGPAPLPIARLDADSLLRGLQAMDTPAVRRAAASLGHRIRAERGAEKAVSIIERLALSSRLSSSMANGRPRGGPSF